MALQDQYPMVYKLLNDYVRAGTDEDNIILTLYGFVRHTDDKFAKQLVDEFDTLSEDDGISVDDLLSEFNTDLDDDYILMTRENVGAVLVMLSEFVSFIYSQRA